MRLAILAATFMILGLAPSFAATAESREERFARIDADHDGAITYAEHAANDDAEVAKMDADGDGKITIKEYAAYLGRTNPVMQGPVVISIARCFFKTVDPGAGDTLSRDRLRAYNDRVFRWLAGDDGRMTFEESKRVPPPEIIPRVACR